MNQRPRWALLALVSSAFAINFLDRQVLSVVAPVLTGVYHFSNTDFSLMLAAFMMGMAIFQLPVGWLMDQVGPKLAFVLIFSTWSVVNAFYALARSLTQFCGLSFLLGAGECGGYTGGLKVISEWLPVEERSLAAGLFNSSFFIGSVMAPPLVAWLVLHHSWQTAFLVPSLSGLLWLFPWLRMFPGRARYTPMKDRTESALDLPAITRGDMARILKTRQTWGLIAIRALDGPLGRFYWFWLPLYLIHVYHTGVAAIGKLAPIPLVFAAAGNLLGGFFSEFLLRRGSSLTFARHFPFVLSCGLATASNFALMGHFPLYLAMVFLCLATLSSNVLEPCFASFIIDIFPERAVGRITALTGIADTSMSLVLLLTTGIVLDHFSYVPVFMGAAFLPLLMVASLFWLIGPIKKVDLQTRGVCE